MKKMYLLIVVLFVFFLAPVPAMVLAQSWVSEVRTGKAGGVSLEAVCKRLTTVYSQEKINREVGVVLAKDLLAVFNLPWRVRETHYRRSEGRGICLDGKVEFQNGNTVMEALVRVLELSGASPKDIGQTPASLRQILIKDLKAGIAEVRRLYKEGYGSQSDFYVPYITELAVAGMRNWNFTPRDLELTPEELEFVKTY